MADHVAICPGSFDPPTYGHVNIIERSLKIFDKVIVGVATNRKKQALFTPEERIDMLKKICKKTERLEFVSFEGLLVQYCKKNKINTLVRGIRTVSDYEYELQMSLANRKLYPNLETIFMMTEGRYSHISSSIIKEIISFGGGDGGMIHPYVAKQLKAKLKGKI